MATVEVKEPVVRETYSILDMTVEVAVELRRVLGDTHLSDELFEIFDSLASKLELRGRE